jgi:two-component system, chemotaxis family, response regulator Rcp1
MKEVHILLVEDSEGDIVLTLEAFKEAKIKNKVSVARDGEDALNLLQRTGKYSGAELPDLILLDINLPKIDGKEVLSRIKNHNDLRTIPVVMLTTSAAEKDIIFSYSNYASCYIIKPVSIDKFMEVVHSIEDFWLSIVTYPLKTN